MTEMVNFEVGETLWGGDSHSATDIFNDQCLCFDDDDTRLSPLPLSYPDVSVKMADFTIQFLVGLVNPINFSLSPSDYGEP